MLRGLYSDKKNIKKYFITIHAEVARAFFKKYKNGIIFLSFLLALLILVGIRSYRTKATVANFSPTSCLGGWQNPTNAQGVFDVNDNSDASQFTENNSAVLRNQSGEIFCGGFQGSVPEGARVSRLTLKFSWLVQAGSIPVPTPVPETPTIDTVLDTGIAPTTDAPKTDTTETVSSEETVQTTPVEETPALEPAPDANPVTSFFEKLITKAHADDTPVETPQGILEVSYTIDGTTWKSLGAVSADDWKDKVFDLSTNEVTDISKLQISVRSLPTIDVPPTIFLDGILLQAETEDIPPTIHLKDASTIVSSDTSDFNADENPTFVVSDPKLSVHEIKTLIHSDKANIISDQAGTLAENTTPLVDEKVSTAVANVTDTLSGIVDSGKDVVNSIIGTDTIPAPDISVPVPVILPPEPLQIIDQSEKEKTLIENPITSFLSPTKAYADDSGVKNVTAVILDRSGKETNIKVGTVAYNDDGEQKFKIIIDKQSLAFRPGLYALKISVETDTATYESEQDFRWGVIAINTNKSVYTPNEEAYIQMGVLDDQGETVCDAALSLVVTKPNGDTETFSTDDDTIKKSGECEPANVVETPDYFTHFADTNAVGLYKLEFKAITENGTRTMNDQFEVHDTVPFSVERVASTRIYPRAVYPMSLYITANQDFSGKVQETVPAGFVISKPERSIAYDSIVTTDVADSTSQVKIISWNIDVKAGDKITLGYYYDAPDISPEFYLLGPLSFVSSSGTDTFHEFRKWQIASDAVCSNITNGDWSNTGGNWSGCTGVGGIPAAADDVTISSGTTINMDVAGVAKSVTVAGTLDTSKAGVSKNLTIGRITLNNGCTFLANASTVTLTATSSTLFTINTGATFTAGTSTVAFTPDAAITVIGGTAASVTFSTLQMTPTITTSRSYTIGAVPITATTLDIKNSAASNALTATMGAAITVSGTLTVGTGTGATTLSTSGSNHALSAGNFVLNNSSVTNINASTMTLTGTSGTIFTKGATSTTFTAGTNSTVIFSGNGSPTAITSGTITFYNLSLTPTITTDRTYTFGSSALTVSGNFTINPTAASSARLTVNTGAATTVAATKTLSITGTTNGTSTLDTTGSNFALTAGFISVASAGTLNIEASTTIVNGTSGTLVTNNGTISQSGGSLRVASDASITIFSGTISIYRVLINAPLTADRTYTIGSGTLALTTFDINPSAAASARLTVNWGNSVTVSSATTAAPTTNATVTLDTTSGNYALTSGSLSINAASTFTANGSTVTLTTANGASTIFTNSGTFNANTSTFIYTGGTATLTLVSATATFYNLKIVQALTSNRAVTPTSSGTITVSNNFDLTPDASSAYLSTMTLNGAFVVAGRTNIAPTNSATAVITTSGTNYAYTTGTMVIDTNATFTQNASTLTLTGTSGTILTRTGTYTAATSSTTIFNGDGSPTALTNNTTFTFYDLTLSPTITADRAYLFGTGALTVNGDFSINPTAASAFRLTTTLGGSVTMTATKTVTVTGTTSGVSTLDTSGSNYAISAGLYNIASAGTFTMNGSTITGTAATGATAIVTNNGTMNAGTSSFVINPNAAMTITSGTPTFYDLNFTPTISSTGKTYTMGSGTVTINHDFTINPTAASSLALTVTMAGTITTAGVVTVTGTTSGIATLDTTGSNYALSAGRLTIASPGTVTLNASTLTLTGTTGTVYSNAGTFTMGNSTVLINGNNSGGNTTVPSLAYYNLTLNNGSETYNLSANTTVTNNLTITAGTLDAVSGQNYTLTVGGNWTNAGTFTARNGSVTFNTGSTAVVTGATTFYDFTISHTAAKEVDFSNTGADIITVTHTFTANGDVSKLLSLHSSSGGNKWHFKPTGTASVSYLDVMDGGCESGAITMSPSSSHDSGNNESCWQLAQTLSFSLSSNAIDFGPLSTSAVTFATDGAASGGSSTEVAAHTFSAGTNASSGYFIAVLGEALHLGSSVITKIGSTPAVSAPGTKQFGMRLTASGPGTPQSPYDDTTPKYGYDGDDTTTSLVAACSSGCGTSTTYSAYYMTNISPVTTDGAYGATLTYIITANY